MGIVEDVQNRQRLAKLLRFETSKSESKEIGLDAYIANMKEGQKSIYYLAGQATSRFLLFSKSVSLVYYFLAVQFGVVLGEGHSCRGHLAVYYLVSYLVRDMQLSTVWPGTLSCLLSGRDT